MARRTGMMKLQVVIPPFIAGKMQAVPKNSRSVVVTYALERLFKSTDPRDVDFLNMLVPGYSALASTKTPVPAGHSPSDELLSLPRKDGGNLPGTDVPGETLKTGPACRSDGGEAAKLDAADIAGGLMDDD